MTTETTQPKILVAEDDESFRELLEEQLQEAGFQVIETEDGFELMDYLNSCQPRGPLPAPDIVLTDLEMPGKSGVEVLAEMREKLGGAKFIVLTGSTDQNERKRAIALGAAAVLDKPIDFPALCAFLRLMLPKPRA